jgi:hypothetical protein
MSWSEFQKLILSILQIVDAIVNGPLGEIILHEIK